MIQRPRFKPSYRVEVVEPEGAVLLSERGHVALPGLVYARLAPLLDGSRTADAIVDLLVDAVSPAEVYFALGQLEAKGYLTEAVDASLPPERAAFWATLGLDIGDADRRLAAATVAVERLGEAPAGLMLDALTSLGVRIGGPADLTVAVTDHYLHAGLADLNAAALAAGRPWLLVKPVGSVLWIGPLFQPGTGACWECMAQRLRANREIEAFIGRREEGMPSVTFPAALLATLQTAVQLAAVEVAKQLVGASSAAVDTVVTLDLLTLAAERHPVVRRPQCPRCGEGVPAAAPAPVTLERRIKQFTVDGGHRAASPEQTLARYSHHVSALTGAVPRLVRVPLDESGVLHVYAAGRNRAIGAGGLAALRGGLRTNCAGKGLSDAQARASALCEALERYSGTFQGDECRRTASYRELGDDAVHPNACMLYSEAQYRERGRWNAGGSPFQRVPEPFDETARIEWTPVWSLTRRTFRYLPAAFCYYDYPEATAPFCRADSNGSAAGNTREEAILQGLLELAERDAVAFWWYNRLPRPLVDLDSFDGWQIRELRTAYAALGREVWVLDLTSDLGIPTFVALSRRTDGGREEIAFGFGAHLDAHVAVTRALTEMNQFLVWLVSRDGRRPPAMSDPEIRRWMETATLKNQPHLVPAAGPPRRCEGYATPQSDDLRDDVLRCQAIVERRGLEMLVLDQTRPDIELPVVKVIVPGLRHFWARFAPGRLYDVPVQLGWLQGERLEEDLNPIPLFF